MQDVLEGPNKNMAEKIASYVEKLEVHFGSGFIFKYIDVSTVLNIVYFCREAANYSSPA